MNSKPHIAFYITVDILITALVIACLAAVLTSSIDHTRKLVEISAAAVEVMSSYRTPVSVQYALHGEWPTGEEELRQWFPSDRKWITSARFEHLGLDGGAMTVDLRPPLAGERLTIHPAVLEGDPLGPVRWLAGPEKGRSNWTKLGNDHTTAIECFIPVLLKR